VSRPLKPTLRALIESTHASLQYHFDSLSEQERNNWDEWKKMLLKETDQICEPRPTPLVRKIRKGIKDIKAMEVVIKPADKNLGIVPIRGDYYNNLLVTHLNSPGFRKVNNFPHAEILRRMMNILKNPWAVETWKKTKWLTHAQNATEPSPFYIIPKLHKKTLGTRPITAQHSYMLAPLSKALASILQQEVEQIAEIAKDSKHIIQQLEQFTNNEQFVFVTYDVEQLYPSIDIRDAIRVLRGNVLSLRKFNGFWTKILQLIMFNNYVHANGQIYVQQTGTATGTQVAPPFANLYLYYKFKDALSNENILFQSRYIDDGLLLVKSETAGREIIDALNNTSNLHLTSQINTNKAIYLDIEVYKGMRYMRESRLDTKVYFKPTNNFLYLPFNSEHPIHQKLGIIKGEAIRCLRNSSSKTDWLWAINLIFKGLMARGYPPLTIKKVWKTIRYEDRQKYIFGKTESNKPEKEFVLSTYHPLLKQHLKRLTGKYPIRPLLIAKRLNSFNTRQNTLLESFPPTVIFKEFDTLGKKLISAKQHWKYKCHRGEGKDTDTNQGLSVQ